MTDQGRAFSTRAFGERLGGEGYAAWLQFQLDAPGWPTVSTERHRIASQAAFSRWARSFDRESLLEPELVDALAHWKRVRPFQPTLVKTVVSVQDKAGNVYDARVFCEEDGHLWVGWLEFAPQDLGPTWVTGHETSQPALAAITYWAQGLEALYFHGALDRARWWSSLGEEERDARTPR